MSELLNTEKRSGKRARVVLCESYDQRVLHAAYALTQHRMAQVLLLGNYDELDRMAVGYRLTLDGIEVVDYESKDMANHLAEQVSQHDTKEGLDPTDPVVAGAWLVKTGLADAVIAGAATTPTHVMRIFLKLLGVADDCHTISGMSLVMFENCDFVRNQVVGLADVSVVPDPTVSQLADIAIQSAANYERITGNAARVAFLSFSTMSSSSHPAAKKIREAVDLTASRKPMLVVDGEMQIDAALIPAVAGTKSPASTVAGNANVLIFPSLDAGNIAVKIYQKFSNYRVIGPILQGMKYPGTYIPRASSADDIVDQVRLLTS